MKETHKRWIRRGLVGTVTAGALFVGLVGFAHTDAGRPLLAYLPGMGACPIGAELEPAARDEARDKAFDHVRGEAVAPSQPALGLSLRTATHADARAWASRHQLACEGEDAAAETHGTESLTCTATEAAPSDGFEQVAFHFDAAGHLVAVDATHGGLDATAAVERFRAASQVLSDELGEPEVVRGSASPDYLLGGRLRQASTEYRFDGYRAVLKAMHMDDGRIRYREHYQAIAKRG